MQSRKLSLMSFAVAAIAFAFTMDAHAATLAVSTVLNHTDFTAHGLGALAIGSVAATGAPDAVKHAATKFFRIAVEGATTDGRTIAREWLSQMAKNYNPEIYGARLNLEHYRGIVPDGPFRAYGDVLALETRDETGPLAGKLGLYAQIAPTPELVALTKAKQKIYTSCEIDPAFADTKQAYLIGLAVTDSPASLGTEILSFAAQNPAASPFAARKVTPTNLFTVADETVIEFEAEAIETPIAAIDEVNRELSTWRQAHQAAGVESLDELPADTIGGESVQLSRYRRAVYYLARADVTEQYRDFDSTKSGTADAAELAQTVDADRRNARQALNDMRGVARTTIELI